MFFLVDTEIKRAAGKPVAYMITKIHDSGKIEDGETSISSPLKWFQNLI